MSKIKTIIYFLFLPITYYAQCNVKTFNKNGEVVKTSSEMFWDSTKTRSYSDGVDAYYLSTNKHNSKSEIVITHILVNYYDSNIPNKLTIVFPDGKKIEKYAENVSYNTFNFFNNTPENTRSRECNFLLTDEEIQLILSERNFSRIIIENYKSNTIMKIITSDDIYSSQLSEMFNCVNK